MNKVKFTGYDSIFATRLRELMSENGTTQKDLAGVTGITRQAISQYMDGSIQPNIEKLYKICDSFKVSADYLLGISDAKSFDIEDKAISEKLLLDDDSIEQLKSVKELNDRFNLVRNEHLRIFVKDELIDIEAASLKKIMESSIPNDIDPSIVLNAFISSNKFLFFFIEFTEYIRNKTLLMQYEEWARGYIKELLTKDDKLIKKYLGESFDLDSPQNYEEMILSDSFNIVNDRLIKSNNVCIDNEYLSFKFHNDAQKKIEGVLMDLCEKAQNTKWHELNLEKLKVDFNNHFEEYLEFLKYNMED